MTPDPEQVMPKELQIMRLQKIFTSLNPSADIQEIDWESYISAEDRFDVNRVSLASHYRGYRWGVEEEVSPEVAELREKQRELAILKKEREEHLKRIEAQETDLRGEVQRVVSEEIGALREELEDLKAQRARIGKASPVELEEMRKDVERTTERLHEMDLILMGTYKKLKELETEKRGILPTIEVPVGPETRICQCGKEVVIKNIFLEDKFVKLAIRSGRLSDFAGVMIRKLCGDCQRRQYGGTLLELVCEDARAGIITGDRIREVGLGVRDFLDICERGGCSLPAGWVV